MTTALPRPPKARRRLFALLETVGLATVLGLWGVACGEPTIQGSGGGTSGGTGPNAHQGGAGGGFTVNTSPTSTGGATGCSGANATACRTQIPEGCGDGINNQSGIEECDDGNSVPGDGCNGNCKTERNWTCPKQGKCTRNLTCGDGAIGPGEVCDDGNAIDGDGCNATCTVQDPAYKCTPVGQACVRVSVCGNSRIEPGEDCDDGNTTVKDGCDKDCHLEGGWVCPNPGKPCKAAPRCGDGVMQATIGEVCDDGNQQDVDGCSADCKTKGAGCVCTPGKLCQCPTMKCGNGVLEGSEKCDDGNTTSGDGCSADCKTVEKGYQCRVVGKTCTPKCGDGVKSATEICDDGNTASGDGCSATCKIEIGYTCAGEPSKCTSATCGNGKVDGAEGCDDGNAVSFDSCSMDCQKEPVCTSGAGCTSGCGDGIVIGEDCDDGNGAGGDGCTKDCKVEDGWTCTQPAMGDKMLVPAVYRDFKFSKNLPNPGNDFETGVAGSYNPLTGIVNDSLDGKGKPVYTGNVTNAHILSVASFGQWYTDVAGVNHTTASKMTLWNDGQGNYVNRYKADGGQWNTTTPANYCGTTTDPMLDADGEPIPCSFKYQYDADTNPTGGKTDCQKMEDLGYTQLEGSCYTDNGTYKALYIVSKADGNPLFFPVDGDNFTPAAELHYATIPPYYDASASWPKDKDANGKERLHNFSFTSEVRYWFRYDKSKTYTLDFVGDDDVWVFINGKLAADLGGVHTPVDGQVVIGTNGDGSTTVTATYPVSPAPTPTKQTAKLGLQDGKVYEIAVFQAERQSDGSSYKLTLSGFNAAPTDCQPTCGDGVMVADEECDCGKTKDKVPGTCAGPNDNPSYNGCSSECKWGPYCGDAQVNGDEACDNGSNNDDYGVKNGCAAGCKLPPRCGDSAVQTDFDEECDDGGDNSTSSDPKVAYGGCMANCKRGGRCGDGVKNGPEACDDGVNDSTYGTCTPECTLGPRCGDGEVQADYGEQCEPKSSNDPDCTPACQKPGGCGDGLVQDPEECDEGLLFNKGEYGTCAPGCIAAPHCGDGVPNGPEQCDDGINDSSYGGCTGQCKLAPHCGDGLTQKPQEECDHGADNGNDGRCTSACKEIIIISQ
jgi:fibro-slime domain-containing protein